jgi:hypothetical protein
MFRRSKHLIVAGLLAAGATTLIPAAPVHANAAAPCQAKDLYKIEEWAHQALVTGTYQAVGAIDVDLTCGIVQNGQTVTRVPGTSLGSAAVVAQNTRIQGQYYSVCYEVVVTRIDDVDYIDTCP